MLRERVLVYGVPLAAIDVRATTAGYDPDLGRSRRRLEIRAVLAAPGDDDSRYDVRPLETTLADDPSTAAGVMALARALAVHFAVPLHPASGEPPLVGADEWISLQGPPPERAWSTTHRTLTWTADGAEVHAAGASTVLADRGSRALYEAQTCVANGLAPPFRCWVTVADTGREGACYHMAAYPVAAPSKHALRSWGAEGRPPPSILRALADAAPDLSPRDRMVALEAAFGLELTQLAPVSAFYAGRSSDAAIDEGLAPALASTRARWLLPLELQRAHAAGSSVNPVLHAFHPRVGAVGLALGLRDAFDLGLQAAKMLVATACEGGRDEDVTDMLNATLAARREADPGARTDDWQIIADVRDRRLTRGSS